MSVRFRDTDQVHHSKDKARVNKIRAVPKLADADANLFPLDMVGRWLEERAHLLCQGGQGMGSKVSCRPVWHRPDVFALVRLLPYLMVDISCRASASSVAACTAIHCSG
jgi:hypothetical protein